MNLEELTWQDLRELTHELTFDMSRIAKSCTAPDEYDTAVVNQFEAVHAEWRRRVGL